MHTSGLLEKLSLRRRRRILGLPIGGKRTDWSQVARIGIGAGAVGVTAAAMGAKKLGAVAGNGSSPGDDAPADGAEADTSDHEAAS